MDFTTISGARRKAIDVVVVDDDPDALALLQLALRMAGQIARGASNAEEAMAAVALCRPDVLVTDLGLGLGASGAELARWARQATGSDGAIGIVILTGAVTDPTLDVDAWLTKPADPRAVVACVEEVAERVWTRRRAG